MSAQENFSEMILAAAKAANDTARIAFEAGHKEGYRLGYQEAMAKAREIFETTMAKEMK